MMWIKMKETCSFIYNKGFTILKSQFHMAVGVFKSNGYKVAVYFICEIVISK
jgi:hypothetical protein